MSELSSLDYPIFRRELLIVASFLAGYGTPARTSNATDLRLFAEWYRKQWPERVRGPAIPSRVVRPFDRSPRPDGVHRRPPSVRFGQLLPVLRTTRPRRPQPRHPRPPTQGRQRRTSTR